MNFEKSTKQYMLRKSFLVKLQAFRNLYFKEHFVGTASARMFFKVALLLVSTHFGFYLVRV